MALRNGWPFRRKQNPSGPRLPLKRLNTRRKINHFYSPENKGINIGGPCKNMDLD
jgi:hypothetical protein